MQANAVLQAKRRIGVAERVCSMEQLKRRCVGEKTRVLARRVRRVGHVRVTRPSSHDSTQNTDGLFETGSFCICERPTNCYPLRRGKASNN